MKRASRPRNLAVAAATALCIGVAAMPAHAQGFPPGPPGPPPGPPGPPGPPPPGWVGPRYFWHGHPWHHRAWVWDRFHRYHYYRYY